MTDQAFGTNVPVPPEVSALLALQAPPRASPPPTPPTVSSSDDRHSE